MEDQNLFEEPEVKPEKSNSEVDSLKKELDGVKKQMEDFVSKKSSWESERSKLEGQIKQLTPLVEEAKRIDSYMAEHPEEAALKLMGYAAGKKKESAESPKSGAVEETLRSLKEELSQLKKRQEEKDVEDQVDKFSNAIYQAVDSLKDEGVEADPQEIAKFMKEQGMGNPKNALLAAKALYMPQILESAKKKSEKEANSAVVLGNSGFPHSDAEKAKEEVKVSKEDSLDDIIAKIEKAIP